jgi:signal transduction histidine kinase
MDIIEGLDNFSSSSPSGATRVSLNESIHSTIKIVQPHHPEVSFEVELEPDLYIDGWKVQIDQVFMNLVVNACQAMKSIPKLTQGRVRICSMRQAENVKISIEDNGCGIATSAIGRIFEPFYTTKSVGEGMGLGLAIVYGIVVRHGGSIQVSSHPGAGSCFRLAFPAGAAGSAAQR